MKKRSVRLKMTLIFAVLLTVISVLTFAAVRVAGGLVLKKTIRDYLISTVEANVGDISYVSDTSEPSGRGSFVYLPYSEGYLRINSTFMKVVNDVHTALYRSDGSMLYGENPLAAHTDDIPFSESWTWSRSFDGVSYDIYDRRLNLELPDKGELWIRGIVPETKSVKQLSDITQLSLFLLPLLILFSGVISYALAGMLLSPVREIERTASEISRGSDLARRIGTNGSGDELDRLTSAFNDMFSRLESSFEAERRFTSDASHELRTPLSVILAQCEYTLEKPREGEDYREALQVIRRQGGRMSGLINDMLDYTRMDQRADRYPLSPTDLSDAVQETADQMALIRDKGIELRCEIEPGIFIEGNRGLIIRLVQNLISNAYRYGRENGHIHVRLVREADEIRLSVRDDGSGISQEDRDKIFDRFYRGDSSRSEQGTGLGLSMVKKIAEIHKADIKLESAPNVGSEFTIVFHALQNEAQP